MESFWRGHKVFITGATGFLGSWLVAELLRQGAQIVALIRDRDPNSELIRSSNINRVSVVNGCLEDYNLISRALNEYECETVFHLGAQTIVGVALRDPLPTFEANIRGTYNLLEACHAKSDLVKRIVVASSDKAYGHSPTLPYTEDMPCVGRHPYDVSKSCADLLTQAYFHTYRLPAAIARCGNIFGGGDLNWSRIVPGTIRSILRNESPIIRSDGTCKRDYIYIRDVVTAYLSLAKALNNPDLHGQAFNFGPGHPHTVLEIVDKILHFMQRPDLQPRILDTATAEIKDQYLSYHKASALLGWKPMFSLEQGLKETISWYTRFMTERNEIC